MRKSPTSVKLWCTLKLIAGLAFLAFAIWLTYWIFFVYELRNIIGIAFVIIFLGIPSVTALFKIPGELMILFAIWRSDDPDTLDKMAGDLRERDIL
ncbi:MAG: hypothetical protein KKE86_14030 [Planctomycetes bacterium]|nr:hypothetical protein [Planctomycetota bacterium]